MDIKCKKKLKMLYKAKIESLKHLCHVYGKTHILTKEMKASTEKVEKMLDNESE